MPKIHLTFTICRHIVQQLQKESATLTKRNQVLEAENKLLATETEQLREVSYRNTG